MLQVWAYDDGAGVRRRGLVLSIIDRGGSDVTWQFHRLGDDGTPIIRNGVKIVDFVGGPSMKTAKLLGAVEEGDAFTGTESSA